MKAKIKIQYLNIQVKLLEDSVSSLSEKREELTQETVDAQTKNEELKNNLKVQEETNAKRLASKLARDKSAAIKDLIANEELIKAHNDDISNKLNGQKTQYDTLLKNVINAEKILELE